MTRGSGATDRSEAGDGQRRSRFDRLLGGAADGGGPRTRPERAAAPASVRRAALLVALEAALLLGAAAVLAYLTVTSTPLSTSNAIAEVVYVGLFGVVMAAAAVGLWRVSPWARGPVVALQLILIALGATAAFSADRPLIGVPVMVLAAGVLYLLATPDARLAFLQASGA